MGSWSAAAQTGRHVGVVASFDFTREAELRRWFPSAAQCTVTYTETVPYRDKLELVSRLGNPSLLDAPVRELVGRGAEAVAYLCTACSFVNGTAGERALREAMMKSGAPQALTTSGAITRALRALRARRVAVVHPYQERVGRLLSAYLVASGFDVVSERPLALNTAESVRTVTAQQVLDAVLAGDHPEADTLVISCTALPTYDALPDLEQRLGKPVVSANQATAWALLGAVGQRAHGPRQRLLSLNPR